MSAGDMSAIQADDRHPIAALLVPYLLDVELPAGYPSQGQELLGQWDLRQSADSAAAAYFNIVWRHLLQRTFHDEVREGARPTGSSRWVRVVSDILDDPPSPWWDDVEPPQMETRDDILHESLLAAREDATTLMSRNPVHWSWGRLHQLDLDHDVFGDVGVAPLEALFNSTGWATAGGSSTVDATAWDATRGYAVTTAPSMRMVVSLADFDDSRWLDLTGVSGHPMSRHYRDQTPRWASGEPLAWPFSREAVQRAGTQTLTLQPAAAQTG